MVGRIAAPSSDAEGMLVGPVTVADAGLKSYQELNESGVSWLGKAPAHWEVRRLGTSVHGCINGIWGNDPNGREDLPCVRVADFDRVRLRVRLAKPTLRAIAPNERNRRLLKKGDLLLEKSGGGDLQPVGVVMLYDHDAEAVCSNFVARMPVSTRCNSSYLTYLHSHLYAIRLNVRSIKQTTGIQNLDSSSYLGEPVAFPPLPEQATIVRFLDYADRRIRHYIRAKQKLIALLEEQKQAIIHQAVTGQIDVRTGKPYPAYKPSGVAWLGDVPEEWTSTRLKLVLSRPIQNGIFKRKDQFGVGAPLINVADVYGERFCVEPASLERVQASADEVRRFRVQAGDIFFVRSSLKLEGTGRSAIATDCSSNTVFECHLVQARPDSGRVNPRYLVVQLNSYAHRHSLISRANVVTMATVAQNTISSCPIMVPPRWEQDGIVEWIDAQWGWIQHVVDGANQQIRLLHEYRTRLIADVVTGKVDVREAAAGLPEVDPLAAEDDPDDGSSREAGLEGTRWRHGVEEGGSLADVSDAERSEDAAEELMTEGR